MPTPVLSRMGTVVHRYQHQVQACRHRVRRPSRVSPNKALTPTQASLLCHRLHPIVPVPTLTIKLLSLSHRRQIHSNIPSLLTFLYLPPAMLLRSDLHHLREITTAVRLQVMSVPPLALNERDSLQVSRHHNLAGHLRPIFTHLIKANHKAKISLCLIRFRHSLHVLLSRIPMQGRRRVRP